MGASSDEGLNRMVVLASKSPDDVTEDEASALAEWYVQIASGASDPAKPALLTRAKLYCVRFLSLYTSEDASRLKITLLHADIQKLLAAQQTSDAISDVNASESEGRKESLDSKAPTPLRTEKRIFKIVAAKPWQATMRVRAGENITITAEGRWTPRRDRNEMHGPQGRSEFDRTFVMPGVELGALIGRINNKMFKIGATLQFVVDADGILEMRMNDADNWLKDNDGVLMVRVESR